MTATDNRPASLTEPMVQAGIGDLDELADGALPDEWIVALRLADVLTSASPVVSPAFYTELKAHFNETQILELGSALSVASGWQRFIEAFGIRPDGLDISEL